uniref:ARAD1C37158p n=1 Tax=Blastobotrys adeninivorans TaxID=409370 RepID=A0A060T9D0_BLAAD
MIDSVRDWVTFTSPTLISSSQLWEHYNTDSIRLKQSWWDMVKVCAKNKSILYLRLVFPELTTAANEQRIQSHIEKFLHLFKNLGPISGVEIDLTAGLFSSIFLNGAFPLKAQEAFLTSLISAVSESVDSICLRLSCFQHSHLIAHCNIMYSSRVTMIHLVDFRRQFLFHTPLLRVLAFFDGADPRIDAHSMQTDDPVDTDEVILYRKAGLISLLGAKFGPNVAPSDNSPPSRSPAPTILSMSVPMTPTVEMSSALPSRRQLEQPEFSSSKLLAMGYLVTLASWTLLIIGVGFMYGLWSRVTGTYEPHTTNNHLFEDITGYPIRNYHVCLLILTGVVLWVWCIISWMGMKFFRHAKGAYSTF